MVLSRPVQHHSHWCDTTARPLRGSRGFSRQLITRRPADGVVPDSGAIRSYPLIDARSGEPSQFANNCSRDIHPHPKTDGGLERFAVQLRNLGSGACEWTRNSMSAGTGQ